MTFTLCRGALDLSGAEPGQACKFAQCLSFPISTRRLELWSQQHDPSGHSFPLLRVAVSAQVREIIYHNSTGSQATPSDWKQAKKVWAACRPGPSSISLAFDSSLMSGGGKIALKALSGLPSTLRTLRLSGQTLEQMSRTACIAAAGRMPPLDEVHFTAAACSLRQLYRAMPLSH